MNEYILLMKRQLQQILKCKMAEIVPTYRRCNESEVAVGKGE